MRIITNPYKNEIDSARQHAENVTLHPLQSAVDAIANAENATPFVAPPYWKVGRPRATTGTCPVQLKLASEAKYWTMPIEPLVSISGSNTIVKRRVLKVPYRDAQRRGSVKELWAQDDYTVTIAGTFISTDGLYPTDAICRLRALCEARESIDILSPMLIPFAVNKIAIESFDFPFTKGLRNQTFTIKAVSDDFNTDNLLIESV